MRRFLHKLQQKSKSTRQKIALTVSGSVTAGIFVIWLTVLVQGGGVVPLSSDQNQQTQQNQIASPLSALENNAGAALSSLQDRWQEGFGSLQGTSTSRQSNQPASSSVPTTTSAQENGGQGVDRVDQDPYWQANDTNQQPQQTQRGADFW